MPAKPAKVAPVRQGTFYDVTLTRQEIQVRSWLHR